MYRLYVEKKSEFDVLPSMLQQNIKNCTDVQVSDVRIFERYDFEGFGNKDSELLTKFVSDRGTENVFINFLPITDDWSHFSIESLPVQFDEKSDYIFKYLNMLNLSKIKKIKINTAIEFCYNKNISEAKVNELKAYLNANIKQANKSNNNVQGCFSPIQDFIKMNDIEVYQFRIKNNLNISDISLCQIRDKYKQIGKNPLKIELSILNSIFNQCKPSLQTTSIENIEIEDDPLNVPLKISLDEYYSARKAFLTEKIKPISLNDMAFIVIDILKQKGQTFELNKLDSLDNNNYIINTPADIDGVIEQLNLCFKSNRFDLTSHFDNNISNFGSMFNKQANVYQSLNLRLTSKNNKKSNINDSELFNAVKRSDYFRKAGFNAGLVNEYVDNDSSSIEFNVSVSRVNKSLNLEGQPGDYIVMLGGKISPEDCAGNGFNQNANPELMYKINKLLNNSKVNSLIKKIVFFDHGAAAALYSAADGCTAYLDKLINSTSSVNFSELISNPCQRALVVLDKQNIDGFFSLSDGYDVATDLIGIITSAADLILINGNKEVCRISRDFITSTIPSNKTNVFITAPKKYLDSRDFIRDEIFQMPLSKAFITNLSLPGVQSQRSILEQFDFTNDAVLLPFGGLNQNTPESAFVSKIPTESANTNTTTVLSYGIAQKMVEVSPFHAASFAVMESLSKIVASGANILNAKLSINQSLKQPGDNPAKWSDSVASSLGAFAAATGMGVAITDNNCTEIPSSNYRASHNFACFALAVAKANEIISASFKKVDSTILMIPLPIVTKTGMPDFDKAKVIFRQFHYLSQSDKIISASVVKEGGVAAAVAKMSFGNGFGVRFLNFDKNFLFSPAIGSIVIETKNPAAFLGLDTILIGKTTADSSFILQNEIVSISQALRSYNCMFNDNKRKTTIIPTKKTPFYDQKKYTAPHFLNKNPKVLIPVFPGSRNENYLKRAFTHNGGNCETLTLSTKDNKYAISQFCKYLNNTNILALPGGNDQKLAVNYAASFLNLPEVKESIFNLLSKNDGLILGVGSGFNILLKAGLLTDAKLNQKGISSPALVQNFPGRHISKLVRVRTTSVMSPWLSLVNVGDVHVAPLSALNGRFYADESTYEKLAATGQIATQFVDLSKSVTAKSSFNPTGSYYGIEGITSADGKVFGRLCHFEKSSSNCYSNVSGSKNQRIFEAAIKYYNN